MITIERELKRMQKLTEEKEIIRYESINLDDSSLVFEAQKVHFDITAFASTNDDFDKELYLIDERYYDFNDYFPQGYIHCRSILIEEKANDGIVIFLIKRTYPHWTFYYYAYKIETERKNEYYSLSSKTVNINGKEYSFQRDKLLCNSDDIKQEIYELNRSAEYNNYPQGVHY